jgi:hypothetical protein
MMRFVLMAAALMSTANLATGEEEQKEAPDNRAGYACPDALLFEDAPNTGDWYCIEHDDGCNVIGWRLVYGTYMPPFPGCDDPPCFPTRSNAAEGNIAGKPNVDPPSPLHKRGYPGRKYRPGMYQVPDAEGTVIEPDPDERQYYRVRIGAAQISAEMIFIAITHSGETEPTEARFLIEIQPDGSIEYEEETLIAAPHALGNKVFRIEIDGEKMPLIRAGD